MTDKERALSLNTQLQKLLQTSKPFSYREVVQNLEEALTHFPSVHRQDNQVVNTLATTSPRKSSSQEAQVWTDGACSGNPGIGGWGAVIDYEGERKELSGFQKQTTNNQMEMMAVIQALQSLPVNIRVSVTTDSQYVVNGMKTWLKGWKAKNWKKADGKPVLNQDLWQTLDKEASQRVIMWHWVKGHAGHSENERCDFLATNEIEKHRV